MGRKLANVYTVLVEGLSSGLAGHELYRFVTESCDGFSQKRLCRAAILAMSDQHILDREALEGIYRIATDQKVRSTLNLRH